MSTFTDFKLAEEDMKFIPAQYLALCPLDGRYYEKIMHRIGPYLGEYGIVRYRVGVEMEWLAYLLTEVFDDDFPEGIKRPSDDELERMVHWTWSFSPEDMARVKAIEATTKHDVKAAELFVAEKVADFGYPQLRSYVHIGCTSEDITNLAYALAIRDVLQKVWLPEIRRLINLIRATAQAYAKQSMPAHTHGQLATPTTVGKELGNFAYNLEQAVERVEEDPIRGKFNGATGNYAAMAFAFPGYNWENVGEDFVEERLGLTFNPYTTQIEDHGWIVDLFNDISHVNGLLAKADWDMWDYISREYFKQKVVEGEVGSSTMPQKVNPINFENSAGNAKVGIGVSEVLTRTLMESRMQRDLSDSTVLRNCGMVIGYSLQAILEMERAWNRISVNTKVMEDELARHGELKGEAVQTVLRKYGHAEAYNDLKKLTRGKVLTEEIMNDFIRQQDIPDFEKERLIELSAAKYIGRSADIVYNYL